MSEVADMSVSDYFVMCNVLVVSLADVSDFEENEIRTLAQKNPTTLETIGEWDGILEKREPRERDLGMNKERKVFCFVNNKWKAISQ